MSEEDMRRDLEKLFPGLITNGAAIPDVVVPAGGQWVCEACEMTFGPIASQNVTFTVTVACKCGTIVEMLP